MFGDYEKIQIVKENYIMLKSGKLPKTYKYRFLPSIEGDVFISKYTNWRMEYIKEFGFALLSEDWIKPLAKWIGDRPCLEIMAGKGTLTYFLRQYGVNIKATDNYTWQEKSWFQNNLIVENLDCIEALKKYGKDVKFVICSWPYMDDNAFKAITAMRKINPKCRMIYIGENYGGCTASDKFFDTIEYCNLETFYKAVKNYSCWEGIHDDIYLLK